MSHDRPQSGFTLIELAIAIFIIALLVGALAVPLAAQVESRNVAATEKTLSEIRDALLGFAAVNGRLPRPAISATDGNELAVACASEAACTGFLPWVTLSVGNTDAWGKLFRYSVTPAWATTGVTASTAGTKVVRTRNTTAPYALVNQLPSTTGSNNATVPAIIMSHGSANHGTSIITGAAFPDTSATNTDEDTNNTATVTFINRTRSNNTAATGGEFDDIVWSLSTYELLPKMIQAGTLP